MNNFSNRNLVVNLGWLVALVGLVYAATIATGSELTRLALLIPFLAVGSILCVVFGPRRNDVWVLLGIALVAGYLLVRGGLSPVWDLARRDLFLILAGGLGYLAASSALQLKSGRALFLGVIVLLVIGNAWVAFYQWRVDEAYAFLRSDRVDTKGVSGFYYHRNYLAGFLEIACPILLAASLSKNLWLGRLSLLVPLLLGLFVCFLSNSRSGFGATVLACLVVFLVQCFKGGARVERKAQFGGLKLVAVVLFSLALMVGGQHFLSVILENRGGSEAAEDSVTGRLQMAGLAIDLWNENPLWGMGAESYSYLFPKYFSGLEDRVGNAQMAHSEYLQLLTDYGAVGLFAVVFLIGTMAFLILRGSEDVDGKVLETEVGGWWLESAAVGVLVAEVLRAAIDFNLHIAPNLTLFAIVIAGGVSARGGITSDKEGSGKGGNLLSCLSRALAVALAIGGSGYGLRAGWNEVSLAREWVAIEVMRAKGQNDKNALRSFSQKAPSFRILREIARSSMTAALQPEDSREGDFGLAAADWHKVVERHPMDGESLANYARCLDQLGEFDVAERYHARALEAVGRRENKYGVVHGVGWHLVRRANRAAQERRPGEALYLYLEAEEAFLESENRRFSKAKYNRPAIRLVKSRIEFFEGARINPEPVEILDWRSQLL